MYFMKKLKKLCLCAMLAAITCVATMISLPIGANGYIHVGDSAVLSCAYLLGPVLGSICAAVGSALADLLQFKKNASYWDRGAY